MNDNIEKYIKQGFKVFACLPNKAPAVSLGFYSATTDIEVLKNQFKNRNDFLIGLPTGNINKIIVIDFDLNKKIPDTEEIDTRTFEELKAEIEENYGPLPDTFQVQTKNGGRHLYYSIEYTDLTSKVRFIDKTLPVDLRANGGYVCTIDDQYYFKYDDVNDTGIDNIRPELVPAPEWLKNIKKPIISKDAEDFVEVLPPEEIKEIRSALSYLSSDDRDLWIKIGLALKSTGSPSAYGLWNEWSKTSDKYKPEEMEKRWKGLKPNDIEIGTVFFEAKKRGWVTTYEKQSEKNTSLTFIKKHIIQERKPFPVDLLKPDGLVGDIIEYINDHSIKSQPILALGAALAAVGALEGRKIQTERGIRTNIYCLGVSESGSGKEAARKCIKDLFYYTGSASMINEDIASDAAISYSLAEMPAQLFLLDEVGRFLKTTNQASKNPHLYNINTLLLKFYNQANQICSGKIYADKNKQIKIDNPNLCLYGTTVPDALYRGLPMDSITSGFLSRMLIFESEDKNPKKNKIKDLTKKPPIDLIDKIKKIRYKPINPNPMGNIDGTNANPALVPKNQNALDILNDFDDYIHNYIDDLQKQNRPDVIYTRTVQIAEQIALIIAGGIDIDNPIITEKEMIYSIQLAQFLSDHLMYIVENFIAENDYHHAVKQILQLIRSNAPEKTTLSQITKKIQHIKAYERNDILESLKDSDQIREDAEGVGKNKKRIFFAI